MDRKLSTELLNIDPHYFKRASSDSLASDSKSSSLNSKLGQDSVSNIKLVVKYWSHRLWEDQRKVGQLFSGQESV